MTIDDDEVKVMTSVMFARARYTRATVVGGALALLPYLWVLWDRFSDPLRGHPSGFFSNFFDVQADAIVDGHLWAPRGSFGLEGFIINGREYMYFGPFPALLRVPLLPFDLENQLTAPSMLLAWLVSGLFVALLVWRIRVLVRGADALLGRAETAALGVLFFACMGGSTLVLLAAIPAVYQEAIAWGAASALGALFFLLGVLERMTLWNVVGYGAFTLAAVLSRATVGWACVLGGVIAAVWLFFSTSDDRARRISAGLLVAALVPLVVGLSVTWIKFGGPFEHPLEEQVYSKTNPERQAFLEANDGALFNFEYLPTTALAYLRPDGVHLDTEYPFVTVPSSPTDVVGDATFDQVFRTPSLTASVPLLFLLALWGLVTAFRPRPIGRVSLLRIPLIAAAFAAGTILVWEGIAPRFLADAFPLVVLAGALGTIDLWRRLSSSARRLREVALGAFVVLTLYGMVANVGAAIQLSALAWDGPLLEEYLGAKSLDVQHATQLPKRGPAEQVVVVNDCATYVSTGEDYFPRWHRIDDGPAFNHRLDITYGDVDQGRVPLITISDPETTTISVEDRAIAFQRWMRLRIDRDGQHSVTRWIREDPGQTVPVTVSVDPNVDRITMHFRDEELLSEEVPIGDDVTVHVRDAVADGSGPNVSVEERDPRARACDATA